MIFDTLMTNKLERGEKFFEMEKLHKFHCIYMQLSNLVAINMQSTAYFAIIQLQLIELYLIASIMLYIYYIHLIHLLQTFNSKLHLIAINTLLILRFYKTFTGSSIFFIFHMQYY